MNTYNALAVAILALLGTSVYFYAADQKVASLSSPQDQYAYKEFQIWKSEHGFQVNANNEAYRFAIFKENLELIEKFNAEETGSLRLGMKKFAALTNEEYKNMMISKYSHQNLESVPETISTAQVNTDIPKTQDWLKRGAVNPVENQGACGSCWAFSTKEGLEGAWQVAGNRLAVFSAQQLVDCSKSNGGCQGGDPMMAYEYTQANGIALDAQYPYFSGTSQQAGPCKYNKAQAKPHANANQVRVSPRNNIDAILSAIQVRPLTMEIAASSWVFQHYSGGVIATKDAKKCGTGLDHGVFATGYQLANGSTEGWWTIKNSWGPGWGEKGYVRVALAANSGKGVCGTSQYVAYGVYNKSSEVL